MPLRSRKPSRPSSRSSRFVAREEVGSRPFADCKVSRHDHRYRGRQGFSVSDASREIPDGSGELLYHGHFRGSALAGDPRSPCFARAACSSRSPSDALLAVASEGALVPRVRPSFSSGAFATGSETGPVLVDGKGSSVDRGSVRDTCFGSSPVFGRVLFRVGRSPPRSTLVRGVVGPGKVSAHQSSRDEGSVLGPSGISRRSHRSSRDSDVRQLYGCGVRQQTRGHGVPGSMLVGQRVAMTLVAPLWPEKEWFAALLRLLTQPPLTLPWWDSASAASLQPLPPRRPRTEPSRVATLKRHFRMSSFLGRAAGVLSGCLRSSTSRLYQSRWQIFCGWCRGRGVAPVNTTVPVVVDFLIHLHHDKGLSISAVKGYGSALNSVLALKGWDLASSQEITMLLRSFSRSVDPVELHPPAWDVALVLQSLTGAPYEPLRTCVFWHKKRSSCWPLPRLSVLMSSTFCRIVSLIPGAGLRGPFLSSRASWQRLRIPLPLLLGLRALLYRPYQT